MLDRLYAALGGQTELIADPAYADDAQLGDWHAAAFTPCARPASCRARKIIGSAQPTATPQSSPL